MLKGVSQIRKWADGGRGGFSDLPTGARLSIFQIIPSGRRDGLLRPRRLLWGTQ